MTGTDDDLFAPPGTSWQPVSPRLAHLRRAVLSAVLVVLTLVVVVLEVFLDLPLWVPALGIVVLAGVGGWVWWLIGRNARRWGYAELDGELYVTRGAMFRRLVVVPYGRMQYVDVQAGPIDRAYGLARVQMHTAAPGTSAHIPGLPAPEAARLRDRLTALGEAQAAGL